MNIQPPRETDKAIPQVEAAQAGVVPVHPFRLLVVGTSGSGKSVVVSHLIRKVYKGYFERLIIFSPTAHQDPAYRGVTAKRDYRKDLKGEEIKALFSSQEQKCKHQGKDKAPRMLIIFDDVIADTKFMYDKEFQKSFFQSRHYSISIILCAQSYMRVPRSCRLNSTDLILFPASESEVKRIADEFTPPHTAKKMFMDLIRHATKEQYSFLYIATLAEPGKKFRRKFDAIIELPTLTQMPERPIKRQRYQ